MRTVAIALALLLAAQCFLIVQQEEIMPEATYELPAPPTQLPVLADFDGDGYWEICVLIENKILVLNASGIISMQVMLEYTIRLEDTITTPLVAYDIDGDRADELIVGGDNITVIFSGGQRVTFDVPGLISSIAVSDINDDGKGEIVAVTNEGVFAYWSNGTELWRILDSNLKYLALADFSGTGRNAIVTSSDGRILIISPTRTMTSIVVGGDLSAPIVADIDSDGNWEIIVASSGGFVAAYDPLGNRVARWNLTGQPTRSDIAVWDVDGDGLGDVIVPTTAGLEVKSLRLSEVIKVSNVEQVIISDADADRFPEILVATDSEFSVLNWEGEPEYSKQISGTPKMLLAGDFAELEGIEVAVFSDSELQIFSSVRKNFGMNPIPMPGVTPSRTRFLGDVDTDADWLPQEGEMVAGTNPNAKDTDSDGMPDGWEFIYELNPTSPADANEDPDNDGLTNYEEYCYRTNPKSIDSDRDLIPDGWEVSYGLNPRNGADANEDPDNDGLTNYEEYCYRTNPLINDTDSDGMPDGWEVSYGLNPVENDADSDPDNDGLTNYKEYSYGTNPLKADTDGDGLPDGEEIKIGTSPTTADTDGDGLPDGEEVRKGTNPLVQDTDGDGISDKNDPFPTISFLPHGFLLVLLVIPFKLLARRRRTRGLEKLVRKRVKVKA